jgi:hypothetical protein
MKEKEIDEFIDLLWLETEVTPGVYEVKKVAKDLTDELSFLTIYSIAQIVKLNNFIIRKIR